MATSATRLIACVLLLAAVAAGCDGNDGTTISTRLVPIPEANYIGIAWPSPDRLVVIRAHDLDEAGTDILRISLPEMDASPLALVDPGCGRSDVTGPTLLPDGMLGFVLRRMKKADLAVAASIHPRKVASIRNAHSRPRPATAQALLKAAATFA